MLKLNLRNETKATAINTKDKTVTIATKEGASEVLPYDCLVIATGADSFMPPIKGKEKQGILSLRGIEDGQKIDAAVKAGAKSAVIMGAGLIGLEVGVGLMERGLKITIVEMLPQILPQLLDADMAKLVQDHLQERGMVILTSKGVEEFLGEEKVTAVMAVEKKSKLTYSSALLEYARTPSLPWTLVSHLASHEPSRRMAEWKPTLKMFMPSVTVRKHPTSSPTAQCVHNSVR